MRWRLYNEEGWTFSARGRLAVFDVATDSKTSRHLNMLSPWLRIESPPSECGICILRILADDRPTSRAPQSQVGISVAKEVYFAIEIKFSRIIQRHLHVSVDGRTVE